MAIYVTGAAGYIGSHFLKCFHRETTDELVLIDNLSRGYAENLPKGIPLHVVSVGDSDAMAKVFSKKPPKVIVHFAASLSVGESVVQPLAYYRNNISELVSLLETACNYGLEKFILSSTAAVYGSIDGGKVVESHPTAPVCPYGHSKLMGEQIVKDAADAYGFKAVALRYFNVAGADVQGVIGPRALGATHLLKVACEVALGLRDKLLIYGSNYSTIDGTGVRDYIHVDDLASAHVDALGFLDQTDKAFEVFNVGYGKGYSVLEVAKAFESLLGHPLACEIVGRRPGDVAEVVANNEKILKAFAWRPHYDDINLIAKTALAWENKLQKRD